MTPQEHLLMLAWITELEKHIIVLVQIIRSRGIVSGDDPRAFEYAANVDAESNAALLADVRKRYLELAKSFGIQTGLEDMPTLAADPFSSPESV